MTRKNEIIMRFMSAQEIKLFPGTEYFLIGSQNLNLTLMLHGIMKHYT